MPYKGTAPILTDLLGGHVHALMGTAAVMPHVRSGKLRALAVAGKEAFEAFLKAESEKWGAIIRARNIKLE